MWTIQPLAAEHVRSLAECHIDCWREAYRGIVQDHVLTAFDIDHRATAWEKIRTQQRGSVHVAVLDDTVIGFAAASASRDHDAPTPLELNALYVRAAHYGGGVADQLIDAAIEPTEPCSLWVFEENPRAISFYRRHGFMLDDSRKPDPWGGAMEVRMVRPITAAQ